MYSPYSTVVVLCRQYKYRAGVSFLYTYQHEWMFMLTRGIFQQPMKIIKIYYAYISTIHKMFNCGSALQTIQLSRGCFVFIYVPAWVNVHANTRHFSATNENNKNLLCIYKYNSQNVTISHEFLNYEFMQIYRWWSQFLTVHINKQPHI